MIINLTTAQQTNICYPAGSNASVVCKIFGHFERIHRKQMPGLLTAITFSFFLNEIFSCTSTKNIVGTYRTPAHNKKAWQQAGRRKNNQLQINISNSSGRKI